MTLALTAYPSSANGTSSGKSSTSPGNIFLSTYSDTNRYQRWKFIDENGKYIETDWQIFGNGIYYINNKNYGQYLHRNGTATVPNAVSGLISDLGNTIRWKLSRITGNEYTIQSADDPAKYLYSSPSNGISLGAAATDSSGSVPDAYRWKISGDYQGLYFLVQNVLTENYLYQGGSSSIRSSILLGNPGTSKYNQYVWRIVSAQNYGNNSSYRYEELTGDFSISKMVLDIDESQRPTVNRTPTGALWTDIEDFTFSKNNAANYNGSVTINNTDHTIKGAVTGAVSIRATHKVTGLTCDFSIDVRALLEKQADYSLPDNIKDELFTIRSMIAQIEASNNSSSVKEELISELELQEDILRADYILTGNNYNSAYANAVIPDFLDKLDDDFSEPYLDNLYKVVANRLLALYSIEATDRENNNGAYFLDIDCNYNEWDDNSKTACNWYLLADDNGTFWNKAGTGIQPSSRNSEKIKQLRVLRYYHDTVKDFVARGLGAATEVKIPKGSLSGTDGYADIMLSHTNGTYIWEVKPNKPIYYYNRNTLHEGRGTQQLRKYIDAAEESKDAIKKGSTIFKKTFSAGYELTPFYLKTMDDTWLEVSPPPYAPHITPDQGLILYRKLDEDENKSSDKQQFTTTDLQIDLIRSTAYGTPITLTKVGVTELAITLSTIVVSGVAITICIYAAAPLAPAVSEVISGTASPVVTAQVTQAVTEGTVTAVILNPYVIETINQISQKAA